MNQKEFLLIKLRGLWRDLRNAQRDVEAVAGAVQIGLDPTVACRLLHLGGLLHLLEGEDRRAKGGGEGGSAVPTGGGDADDPGQWDGLSDDFKPLP